MGNILGTNQFSGGRDRLLEDLRNLRGGSHLLGALTQRNGQALLRDLEGFDQLDFLRDLAGEYARYGALTPQTLAQMMRSGMIPPQGLMERPSSASCGCPSTYAAEPSFEHAGGAQPLQRFLHANPDARQFVEMALGGRIVPGGSGDQLFIQPFNVGGFPGGGRENAAAVLAQSMLGGFSRTGGPQAAFQGMVLEALSRMVQQQQAEGGKGSGQPQSMSDLRASGHSPFVDWTEDSPNMARRRGGGVAGGPAAAVAQAMMGGQGNNMMGGPQMGMDMQACSSPQQASGGCGGGDDIGAVLSDGGLTVEDKSTLMIMMIMKKMDQDIERQANYINSLQQQQQGGGGKGGGKGGGGGAPSIDVETMKLKRLIDKRSQMFDMLRQIIDKYNQTAKGIIDSMGR